jgi:hypothetical protein
VPPQAIALAAGFVTFLRDHFSQLPAELQHWETEQPAQPEPAPEPQPDPGVPGA